MSTKELVVQQMEQLPEAQAEAVLKFIRELSVKEAPKVSITYRKGTHAVGSTGRRITSEQVRAALEDFP
jgi:hypothetical protein